MKQFILMADIIASGEKDQEQLMKDFKKLINEINTSYAECILSPLTITLGDEFQCILKDIDASIQIIIHLEEAIIHKKMNFKLRYILNQGIIDTPINTDIAYGMLGAGLTEARQKLTDLKHQKSRFSISIVNHFQNEILMNAFKIFENITAKWDVEKDYEVVSNFIKFKDYKIVSEAVHKTRSQLWKREKTLNIESYNSVKSIIQLITKK